MIDICSLPISHKVICISLFKRRTPSLSVKMNASDIVKRKQNTTLYKAYYQPTVFQSTTFSTVNTVSSIIRYVSSGVPITSTSYTSCTQTVYLTLCEPTFTSYSSRYSIESGMAGCTGKGPKESKWKANRSTTIYSYSTIYSSLNTSTLAPSSIRIFSTIVNMAPTPLICPFVFQQGTSFASQCPSCSHVLGSPGSCCEQCS